MWRLPSTILKGGTFNVIPTFEVDTSFVLLGIGGVYTTKQFNIDYSHFFDVYVLFDQVGTAQLQVRYVAPDPWRNLDPPVAIVANTALRIAGYRAPNRQARWVFTNTSGIGLGTTEIVTILRSL